MWKFAIITSKYPRYLTACGPNGPNPALISAPPELTFAPLRGSNPRVRFSPAQLSPKDAGFGIHVLGKDSCCSQGHEPPTAGDELSPLPKIRNCWITTGLNPLQNPNTKLPLGSPCRSLGGNLQPSDVGNPQENPLEQTFHSLKGLSFPWAAGITPAVGQSARNALEKLKMTEWMGWK